MSSLSTPTTEINELASDLRASTFEYSQPTERASLSRRSTAAARRSSVGDYSNSANCGVGEQAQECASSDEDAAVDLRDNESRTKLPLRVKLAFGCPKGAVVSIYMLITVHAMLYYEYLGAKLAYLAFFTAFARSFDVLVSPLMSWWSDSARTKWGRRRPFIAVGCVCFSFTAIMLLSPGVVAPYLKNDSKGISYYYGIFYLLFFLSDDLCNIPYNALGPELTEDTVERSNMYFVQGVFGLVGTLVGAVSPPAVETGLGLSKDWSFCLVGLFFGFYFVAAQLNLVYNIRERQASMKQDTVPMVTSITRAVRNKPFSVLLTACFLDAVGWFATAATMPFYLKYVVRPSVYSDMSDEMWLAIGFAIFFCCGIFATPVWLACMKRFGKYKTWLGFNVMSGVSYALFAFVGEGSIKAMLLIIALNGAPLGARFLNDSTLADTIDYDEFLSGERREAQFTMLNAFVPKVVSIPMQAIPLALIAASGFVESVDGEPQAQPPAVKAIIQVIYIALPVLMNVCSFLVKLRYPIKAEATNRLISEGVALHTAGVAALDPITKKLVQPKTVKTAEEKNNGALLDHFSSNDLAKLAEEGNTSQLLANLRFRFFFASSLVVMCLVGVITTFDFLDDSVLSVVPALFQIGFALSTLYAFFTVLRVKAAKELNGKGVETTFIRQWRLTIDDGDKRRANEVDPVKENPLEVAMKLRDAIIKVTRSKEVMSAENAMQPAADAEKKGVGRKSMEIFSVDRV